MGGEEEAFAAAAVVRSRAAELEKVMEALRCKGATDELVAQLHAHGIPDAPTTKVARTSLREVMLARVATNAHEREDCILNCSDERQVHCSAQLLQLGSRVFGKLIKVQQTLPE